MNEQTKRFGRRTYGGARMHQHGAIGNAARPDLMRESLMRERSARDIAMRALRSAPNAPHRVKVC